MQKAQAAAAAAAGPQAQYEPGVNQKDEVRIQQPNPTQNPPQIELQEVADEVLDDDVRSDILEYDEDEYELDDDDTKSEISQGDHGHRSVYTPLRQVERTRSRSPSPRPHVDLSSEVLRLRQRKHEISASPKAVSPRKRSVDEIDDTSPRTQSREDRDTSYHHRGEPGTPPKRPRVLSPTLLPSPDLNDKYELQNSPSRLRKRSSEDLGRNEVEHGKRIKMSGEEEDSGSGDSPPRSTSMSVTAEESDDVGDENVGVVRVGLAPAFGAATVPRSATPQDKVIPNGGLVPPPPPVAKRKIPLPGQGRKRANVDDDQ
jgi:hypothetical protein